MATRLSETETPEVDDLIEVADFTHEIPDIITFVTSSKFLDRPNLYPRQATLLKTIFLQTETFTDYDYEVIAEWETAYIRTANDKGEGNNGIVPGVLDRVALNRICPCSHDWGKHELGEDRGGNQLLLGHGQCRLCVCERYQGRKWFREVVSIVGRRGSKGHMGALCGSYVLWHYLKKGDPQSHYGVDRDKRLSGIVFAGKKEQAKAYQWRDLNNIIMGAPCFTKYISRPQAESLTVRSPKDKISIWDRKVANIDSYQDQATFEIIPKESTELAGRGPASFMQFYDEAAHVVKAVAKAAAEDTYEAATPALDQFGQDAFIYIPTSPWQQIGLAYDKYQQAIEEYEDGSPVYPEMLMVQLTSWDIYLDWEKAHKLSMLPSGKKFVKLSGAIQTYDHQMEQLERANPDTFKVERRSHWAAVMDAYLNPDRIAEIWLPWPEDDSVLTFQQQGKLSTMYRAHGDPSKSGAGFGFAIAHVEGVDHRGFPHVIFDVIHAWLPEEYEGHEVDYEEIEADLSDYLDRFMPAEMTFDQFNSAGTIQKLRRHARDQNYPKRVSVYERTATAPLNWKTYETFKTALGLNLIHSSYHDLANQELTFLQDLGGKVDHPTAGPVQTKDLADCMAIVTYELIGDEISAFIGETLSEMPLRGSAPGGMDAYREQRSDQVHEGLSSFARSRGLRPNEWETRRRQDRRRRGR